MVDEHLRTRIGYATQTVLQTYTIEFEKKAQEEKDRYNDLVEKSIKDIIKDELDKDLFKLYGKIYSLKRDREDKDKNEDPLAGSDHGLKKQKMIKDVEPSKGYKSKEIKSSLSKGTKSQLKSSSKSFKKPERPSTPDPDWNTRKSIYFRPPQTWISRIAQAEKPPLTFDELMSTPIDFSAYVMHNLKIDNLTQKHLVRLAFNLLKGACKSRVKLEYHFEECYKAITDQLDWNDPEGQEYPFDLSKPLPLIQEDLQLGVKSHQKKLNITKPETYKSDISKRTSYTAYSNPQGVIYLDKYKRNRLMRSDELYKFCDGTLTSVRTVLHDIASILRMDYLP
ncbi:hypothetical protein Tco_0398131 [Tanacetum coccineum]